MKKRIKTALTSFGMSGQVFHGPLLKVNPQFEVVKIMERTKNFSRELFPEAEIIRKYSDILEDPGIELVIVNTPDDFHYTMVKSALVAGKHVVVEKPMTQKRIQAEELMKLAMEKKLHLTVFQSRRFDGDFLTVKKILEYGQLGRLIEFESHYDRYRILIDKNSWKENGNEYTGVLYNLGSHMIDQVVVLFGKPRSVTAHLKIVRNGGNVNDYYDIRLEYETFSAILKSSYLVYDPGPRYSIHGENGSFHKWGIDPQEERLKNGDLPVGGDWGSDRESFWGHLTYLNGGVTYNSRVETLAGNYNLFYENLYRVLTKGAEPVVNLNEVIAVIEIMEACIESNTQKKTILLD